MIRFDKEKLELIKSDYSIFLPSPKQMEIIFDLAEHANKYFIVEEELIRLILIKAIVKFQIENNQFHQKGDFDSPLTRLVEGFTEKENVISIIMDLVENVENESDVRQIIDRIFKHYAETYAGR